MAPLPQGSPVVDLIYRWREQRASQERQPRNRLGGSLIGHPCDRAIWYKFRHVQADKFDGRMLRLLDRGQLEEDRFVEELEGIGVTVTDRQKTVGTGIMGGSIDGIALGLPEAPKTPHLLEFKTHNQKSFGKLQYEGMPLQHQFQMQFYMHLAGLTRGLYMAACKNTDHLFAYRLEYDAATALKLIAKGQAIIDATEPPAKAYGPTHYFCKNMCAFNGICHNLDTPDRVCRTCNDCVVTEHGSDCASDNKANFPACHRFIPALVPFDQVDYDGLNDVVIYDGWRDDGRSSWR